jgi:hypothetical protein
MKRSDGRKRAMTVAAALVVAPASAQGIDMAAMQKWGALDLVHYRVVGVHDGDAAILFHQGVKANAKTRDRIEIDFDWSQSETKLKSAPVIRNFPTTYEVKAFQGCPMPRVEPGFEFATMATAANGPGVLSWTGSRATPKGAIPHATEEGPCGVAWYEVAAKTEPVSGMLTVIPAIAMAMPEASGITLSADKKTMILPKSADGWTWSFTPTPK